MLRLCALMARLRAPDGCPWDRQQTLRSLRPFLIEESHEVLEVIDALDDTGGGPRVDDHRSELGDLLFQVIFQAELQREQGRFDFADVATAIADKLERRHPHVFDPDSVLGRLGHEAYEQVKAQERAARQMSNANDADLDHPPSSLDGLPWSLPGLLRAERLGRRAHAVGFDWPDHRGVLAKIREELDEVEEALAGTDRAAVGRELGDLLYATVNLCRHVDVDPEQAIHGTMRRFEARFRHVEAALRAKGLRPESCSLEVLDNLWEDAKRALKRDVENGA